MEILVWYFYFVWLKQKLAAREVEIVLNETEDQGRSGPHGALGYTSSLGLCSQFLFFFYKAEN